MEPSDVEKWIGELEIAVDRLRSLYEQYFVGIEKIEPAVARKDVDRRIYALRKEQIRNTALRFRFQMVLQRYNTYQTHWQRVCREIENGTYKRHMIRAQRRFGNSARPPPLRGRSSAPPPASVPPSASSKPPSSKPSDLPRAPQALLAAQVSGAPRAPGAPEPRPPSAPTGPGTSSGPTGPGIAAQLAALGRGLAAPPLPTGVGLGVPAALGKSPPPRPLGSPGARPPPPATGDPPLPSPVAPRPGAPPPLVWKKTASLAPPVPASAVPSPGGAVPRPPGPPPVPSAAPRPPGPPPAPSAVPRSSPLSPAVPSAVPRPPVPAAAPRTAVPSPASPSSVAARPPPSREAPLARPDPRPEPPHAPAPSSDLSEVRLRQLYTDLVETKRRQNESTVAITYQSVAKSLRESSDRLRQKHGRAVDFEVTVKDGKAILRPVIK